MTLMSRTDGCEATVTDFGHFCTSAAAEFAFCFLAAQVRDAEPMAKALGLAAGVPIARLLRSPCRHRSAKASAPEQ
jgi:hypothetical protein